MHYRYLMIPSIIILLGGFWWGSTPPILSSWKGSFYKWYERLPFNEKMVGNGVLVDPEMASQELKPFVMQGLHIMLETKKYAPDYAGDRISCTNCHFSGGNTLGGRNNGISLVGVNKLYPRHLPNQQEYTLADRINACFERSLNGKPLPKDSQEMKALLTYFDWISQNVATSDDAPWLGLKKLHSQHIPNPQKGAKIYATTCAMCHGSTGQGQIRPDDLSYPPLWGKNAFNDVAGMNNIQTFASFIHPNMPYGRPSLSVEDAIDVASFVTSQPRPHFREKNSR